MTKVPSFPGIQIPLVLILSLPNASLFCFLQQAFDQNLHMVGTFATCEQFWSLYSHLIRPGDLQSHSDFHIFKRGIKPLWEVITNRSYEYSANLNSRHPITESSQLQWGSK